MAEVMAVDADTGASNRSYYYYCCSSSVLPRLMEQKQQEEAQEALLRAHARHRHSYSISYCMSFLTKLRGHNLAIRGIAFPENSKKLYSGAVDKKIVVWDASTGKGTDIPAKEEVGCMIHHGPCIFLAIPGSVKAFDTISSTEQILPTPGMQINALQVAEDQLFAGCEDGQILSWKFNDTNKSFEPVTSFKEHAEAVITLAYNATSRVLFLVPWMVP